MTEHIFKHSASEYLVIVKVMWYVCFHDWILLENVIISKTVLQDKPGNLNKNLYFDFTMEMRKKLINWMKLAKV